MSSPQKEVAFAASPPHSAERLRLSGQSILSVYLSIMRLSLMMESK
jgi:hypothetical protein